MRISATGRSTNPAGFTLIELLVVLTIVAVLAGILVLNYGRSERDLLEEEAARLATLLNLAAEESIVRSADMGVVLEATGYHFVVFDPRDQQWQPVSVQPLTARQLSSGVALEITLPEEGMTSETRRILTALRNREMALRPQLLLFPSGEMTPFEVTLQLAGLTAQVSGDGANPVQWSLHP